MLEKLKVINDKLILINKDNENEVKKQHLIKKLLSDRMCFFKIDIETAYSILKDLNIKDEDLSKLYKDLIDIKNYN